MGRLLNGSEAGLFALGALFFFLDAAGFSLLLLEFRTLGRQPLLLRVTNSFRCGFFLGNALTLCGGLGLLLLARGSQFSSLAGSFSIALGLGLAFLFGEPGALLCFPLLLLSAQLRQLGTLSLDALLFGLVRLTLGENADKRGARCLQNRPRCVGLLFKEPVDDVISGDANLLLDQGEGLAAVLRRPVTNRFNACIDGGNAPDFGIDLGLFLGFPAILFALDLLIGGVLDAQDVGPDPRRLAIELLAEGTGGGLSRFAD